VERLAAGGTGKKNLKEIQDAKIEETKDFTPPPPDGQFFPVVGARRL